MAVVTRADVLKKLDAVCDKIAMDLAILRTGLDVLERIDNGLDEVADILDELEAIPKEKVQ